MRFILIAVSLRFSEILVAFRPHQDHDMQKRRFLQIALAGLAGTSGLLAAPILSAAAAPAAAQALPKREVLVAGMDAAYPPFGSKDSKTGEFVGYDVDVIRAIGRASGFDVKVENLPFDGLIPALKTGMIHLAINDITVTEERLKSVDFTDRYYIAGLGVVVAKGCQDIKTPKDLEGKRIAVTIGSTGEIAAKSIPNARVRVFNTQSDCFLELGNRGVDAVLNDLPTNDYYAVTAGAGRVESLPIALTTEDLAIAVKKGRKDLIERLNKGLAAIKASGEFTEIYKKWFGREPSPELLK